MFHVFQFCNSDFMGLFSEHSEDSGLFYDYSSDNISMKYNEVMFLLSAYINSSKEDYIKFLTTRSLRSKLYSKEVMYEKVTETIEGFATYVELLVLKQLNKPLFEHSLTDLIENLKDKDNYFSMRELSYDVGALLLITMNKFNIDFNGVLLGKSFISDLCCFEYIKPNIEEIEEIKDIASKRSLDNQKAVNDFLSSGVQEVKFDRLIGYNPMGAKRFNDKVLIKYLVIVIIDGIEQSLNGSFCLVCDNNYDWIKLYKKNE